MSCQHLQFSNTKSDSTCTPYILNFQKSFTTQYGGEEKHNAVRSVVIEGKKKGIGRGWLVPYLAQIISGYIGWSCHALEKKNYLFSPYYN